MSLDLIFNIGILIFITLYGTGIILIIIFSIRVKSSIGKEIILIRQGVDISRTIEKMTAYGYEIKEVEEIPTTTNNFFSLTKLTFVKVR